MNDINEAILLARDTLMYVPLIIFCFIPVKDNIKGSIKLLLQKIILAVIAVLFFSFFLYYVVPYHIANLLNAMICFLIFFGFYQKVIEVARSHLLFIFLSACLLGGFSYLIYHVADIFIHPNGQSGGALSTEIFMIQIIFECVLILVLYYPTKKYLGWLVRNFHEENIWFKVCIFPFIFTTVFYVFIPIDNSKMYIGRALDLYLIAIFVFLIIAIIIYIMFYQVAYHMVEHQKARERALYLEIETQQYHKLQEYVENTARIRHDFRFHLTALSTMMQEKNYNEAQAYINEYSLTITTPIKKYCNSLALNAVLNHYASCCQEADISYNFSVRIYDDDKIKDTDFCVLVGNLLENACYACRTQEKRQREIELKIGQTSPHVIVLSIRNPYCGNIVQEEDEFLSTKHPGKGQGLNSVSMIAEKYHGSMKVKLQNHQFIVKVLMNI